MYKRNYRVCVEIFIKPYLYMSKMYFKILTQMRQLSWNDYKFTLNPQTRYLPKIFSNQQYFVNLSKWFRYTNIWNTTLLGFVLGDNGYVCPWKFKQSTYPKTKLLINLSDFFLTNKGEEGTWITFRVIQVPFLQEPQGFCTLSVRY